MIYWPSWRHCVMARKKKFVEPKFRNKLDETDEHWMFRKIIPNKLHES